MPSDTNLVRVVVLYSRAGRRVLTLQLLAATHGARGYEDDLERAEPGAEPASLKARIMLRTRWFG